MALDQKLGAIRRIAMLRAPKYVSMNQVHRFPVALLGSNSHQGVVFLLSPTLVTNKLNFIL